MSTPEFQLSGLRKFDSKAKDVIALAMVLGWSARWSNSKMTMVVLRGNDGKTLNIPTTNVRHDRAKSWISQVLTHSSPDQLKRLAHGDIDMMSADPAIQRIVVVAGTTMLTDAKEELARRQQQEREQEKHLTHTVAAAMHEVAEAIRAGEAEREAGTDFTTLEQVIEEATKPPAVTIVERKPYMVYRGGRDPYYESPAVDEVVWSDGHKGFACRHCDYIALTALSVGTHAGQAHKGQATPAWLVEHRRHKAEQREDVIVTDQSQPEPRPVPELVALHGITLLTHHIRTKVHTGNARDVAVELLELPFEVRAKLANVLLNGKDFEAMRTAAEEAIDAATRERDEAIRERDEMKGTWDALRSLIK